MKFRPRLVPAVIVAATVLLGVKVSDIFSIGGAERAEAQAPSSTVATGAPVDLTKQANAATDAPAAGALSQLDPQAGNSPPGTSPQPTPGQPTPDQQSGANAAPQSPTPGQQTADASTAAAAAGPHAPPKDPLLLSPAEIEVLQQLSQRRSQLDQRASELDQQQVVLEAAEKRVDQKIAELQSLQQSIQAAVDKQNAAADARIQSLVKIYETMKPADAAQILSQLDMPILLQLLTTMKESKTAPILAAMEPAKAQAITTAMAQRQSQMPATAIPASATAPQPPTGP